MDGVIMMRNKDLERIKIMQRLATKQITQLEAGKILDITDRQVRKLFKRYKELGNKGVISKKLGQVSNRRLPEDIKDKALKIITESYSDFGPTLAAEKLQKINNITLSVETVRQLMASLNMWFPKASKPIKTHPLRARRPCVGELIIIDGSIEFWFEERGPKCVLLVFIDDATSCIGELFFTPVENLDGYFNAMERYLKTHGRPLAIYTDRHAVFQVERKSLSTTEKHITQFERAMEELGIKLIHANSPQAKGRVERCNRTLQDRFIKELRLKGISDMETANLFAKEYRLEHNQQFGVPPAQCTNLHRSLEPYHNLEKILTPNHLRTIQKDLTFQYENVIYQTSWGEGMPILRGKEIVVWRDREGCLHAEWDGKEIAIEEFGALEYRPVANQASAKNWIIRKQRYRPNKDHPYKRLFRIN